MFLICFLFLGQTFKTKSMKLIVEHDNQIRYKIYSKRKSYVISGSFTILAFTVVAVVMEVGYQIIYIHNSFVDSCKILFFVYE